MATVHNLSSEAMERGCDRILAAMRTGERGRGWSSLNIERVAGKMQPRNRPYSQGWATYYLQELVERGKIVRYKNGRGYLYVVRTEQPTSEDTGLNISAHNFERLEALRSLSGAGTLDEVIGQLITEKVMKLG